MENVQLEHLYNYITYIIIVVITIIIYDLGMLWAVLGSFGFAGDFDLECGAFSQAVLLDLSSQLPLKQLRSFAADF